MPDFKDGIHMERSQEEGTAVFSMTSDLLERNKLLGGSEEQETIIKLQSLMLVSIDLFTRVTTKYVLISWL